MRVTSISFTPDLSKAYIYVENTGVHPLKISRILLNGEDAASVSEVKGENLGPKDKTVIITRPENGFRRGEEVEIRIEAGKTMAEARIRAFPAVFPVGIYGGHGVLADRASAMEAIEMGLDTLVAGVGQLDAAHKYGFRVIAYAPRVKGSVDINLETIRKYVDHPAMLAWYVIDEPDIWEVRGSVPEGWTARWTSEIKRVDKRNPTYIVLCNPRIFERFAKIPDVLAIDPYPVSRSPLRYVAYMADRAVTAASPSPVWMIPQAFRHGRPSRRGHWGWNRFPAPDEERVMVFMGLAHGLKGVIYFIYSSFVDNPNDPVEGVSSTHIDAIMLRRAIARMSGELHALGPLIATADVFTETDSGNAWSRTGSVEVGSLLSGDKAMILVAVNHNYVSTPEGFKITPAEDVVVEARVPEWFEVKDIFSVTQQGLKDVKAETKGRRIRLTLPEIRAAATIVVAGDDQLRGMVEEEWNVWRRY